MKRKLISLIIAGCLLISAAPVFAEPADRTGVPADETIAINETDENNFGDEADEISSGEEADETPEILSGDEADEVIPGGEEAGTEEPGTDVTDADEACAEFADTLNTAMPTEDAALTAGIYTIRSKKNEDAALAIPGGAVEDKVVTLEEFTGERQQKFVITPLGGGLYSIVNYASGRSLDIPSASTEKRTAVQQHWRNHTGAQTFRILKTEDGYYTFKLSYAELVFDVKGGIAESGGTIQIYPFNDTDAQFFKIEKAESEALEPGFYEIHSAAGDNLVVTVAGSSADIRKEINLSEDKRAKGQKFTVTETDGGLMISAQCSWHCLDIQGGTIANGTQIQQYHYNNTEAQKWIAEPLPDGSYRLRSAKDQSFCLTPSPQKAAAAGTLKLNRAFSEKDRILQSFTFEKLDKDRIMPDGPFTIAAFDDKAMVLDVESASRQIRANVRLWRSNSTNAQKYYLDYQGGGYYAIRNANSNYVLDAAGGSSANKTNIQQYRSNGTAAQKWKFISEGNGNYRLQSGLGPMLDINHGQAVKGANIQLYQANKDSNAQLFSLIPVRVIPTKHYLVAIDAGHQRHANTGKEPIGPGSSTMKQKVSSGTYGSWSHLNEYELNLQVALKLQTELQNRGYDVYMIRTTHDVNISNAERAQMAANAGADIFIRVHANSSDNSSVRGAMAYQPSSGNPYLTAAVKAGSQRLSALILNNQCAATGLPNRGLLTGDDMTGINWAKMPVTIIEMGFMSNPQDDLYMASAGGQAAIVKGIANGVDQYFK